MLQVPCNCKCRKREKMIAVLLLHLSMCFCFCAGRSSNSVVFHQDPITGFRYVLPKPNFENGSSTHVRGNVGDTVFLPCSFNKEVKESDTDSVEQGAVSWIRRRDWSILSAGVFSNTQDDRFAVLHQENTEDYTLQIKYVQLNDSGTYECQVPTGSGFSPHFIELEVIQHRAVIIGARELHVSTGDAFSLTCVIEKILTPPVYVMWLHQGVPLNYAPDKPRFNVGVNPNGTLTTSTITVVDAKSLDTGNYTCTAPNAVSDSVMVYVTGDEVAAVQRIKPASSALQLHPSRNLLAIFISLHSYIFLVRHLYLIPGVNSLT